MVKKLRRHSAAYKLRNALQTLEDAKMVSHLSSEKEIHTNTIRAWRKQLLEDWPNVFARKGSRRCDHGHSSLGVLRRGFWALSTSRRRP